MNRCFHKRKGVTLTELLIAIVLVSVVILAATSVDITSRRFFSAVSKGSLVQDEAKIAMEHIVKHIQLGIGDITNPGTSEGFTIYDGGARIRVNLDDDLSGGSLDGRYTATPPDRIIEYRYNFPGDPANTIVFDPNVDQVNDEEEFAKGMVYNATFGIGSAPNQVEVNITVRKHPTQNQSLDNPQTTLTSSIVLRAMSAR